MFFFGVSPACGAASAGGVFGASVAVPELGVSAAGASGAAGEAGSGVSARAVANEAGARSATATSVTKNLRRLSRRTNNELHIGESVAPTGLMTNRAGASNLARKSGTRALSPKPAGTWQVALHHRVRTPRS